MDCIDDLARLVERSSNVNIAQPVGNQLTGERIVPLFDWHNYFVTKFRKLSHIKQIHKFVFSSDCPGTVKISEFSNTDESTITLPLGHHLQQNSFTLQGFRTRGSGTYMKKIEISVLMTQKISCVLYLVCLAHPPHNFLHHLDRPSVFLEKSHLQKKKTSVW